jgi:spore cortex biosynthesis protein YabQ
VREGLFVSDQVTAFAVTVVLGLLTGLLYDFFRVIRKMARPTRWLLFFFDLAFWLLATFFAFPVLLATNSGEVRAYVLAGMGLGAGVYALLFSRPVFNLMDLVASKTVRIIHTLLGPPVRFMKRCFVRGRRVSRTVLGGAGRRGRAACQKIRGIRVKKSRN